MVLTNQLVVRCVNCKVTQIEMQPLSNYSAGYLHRLYSRYQKGKKTPRQTIL